MSGRARRRSSPLAGVILVAVATLVAVGCAGPTRATFPPLGQTPAPAGGATAATAAQVIAALAAVGLQAAESNRPYRPPEGALFAGAPRSVLEVTLPDDPNHGYVVVYALASGTAAQAAATDQATYIASGPGRVQFPLDSHFVLRVVGSTVAFFTWSPGTSPDPRTKSIEDALTTIGTGVPIPG